MSSWYTQAISSEEDFLQEVRQSLRHITAELVGRLTRVMTHLISPASQPCVQTDLTDLLMRDLVPAAVSHLDSWLWARHHLATAAQSPAQVNINSLHKRINRSDKY